MLSICPQQELEPFRIEACSIHPGQIVTQSGASDAKMSPVEAAQRLCKWIQEDSHDSGGSFVEPYTKDWER